MMQERTLISALSFHLLSLSSHMVHKHHVIIFHVRGLFKFGSKDGENVGTLSFHAVRVFLLFAKTMKSKFGSGLNAIERNIDLTNTRPSE